MCRLRKYIVSKTTESQYTHGCAFNGFSIARTFLVLFQAVSAIYTPLSFLTHTLDTLYPRHKSGAV